MEYLLAICLTCTMVPVILSRRDVIELYMWPYLFCSQLKNTGIVG